MPRRALRTPGSAQASGTGVFGAREGKAGHWGGGCPPEPRPTAAKSGRVALVAVAKVRLAAGTQGRGMCVGEAGARSSMSVKER